MAPSQADNRIGPYRIVDTLGEGGMGVVYLAEQTEPIRREVALKVLRVEADSPEVLARFQAERQTLAVMDHPSVAKIFDAGITADGRSYFVMELVHGAPLGDYCDQHRLSVEARVRLFVDVCGAVQHAHQKGIIHRDLKPSNILVSEADGRPLPRIIDFGIAKAVRAEELDAGLTQDDQVIGTPAYMSPEQISGLPDVDTRTDIYSLGTVLYEVLSGVLPYDTGAYRGWAALAAHLHRDPPSPAKRFGQLAETQETVSRLRSTTPTGLKRELAGDLGWIVSHAMEKERELRYDTVSALAEDLERYLAHEPVRARGAGTVYVLRKFARRHRLAVAFGATVAVGLVAFTIVTAVQAEQVARARDEAEARRGQAENLIDFMLSDLRDKLQPIGRLDVLDDVGAQATQYFAQIPQEQFTDDELASRSQALYQIGSVRLEQGDFDGAVEAFAESLRLARALSERSPDDAERLFGLSQSHFYMGYASWLDGNLESAEEEFVGYLTAAERLVELEPENSDYRLEVGFAHSNLGSVREARGALDGAVESYTLTLDVLQSLVDGDPENIDLRGELAESHNKLGVVLTQLGDFGGALEQHRLELEHKEQILALEPSHAYWRFRWALALGFTAEVHELTAELEEGLELRDRQVTVLDSLAAFDPANTGWRRNLAMTTGRRAQVLRRLGRYERARESLDRAEREISSLLSTDSTSFGWRTDLAAILSERAKLRLVGSRPREGLEAANRAVTLVEADDTGTAVHAGVAADAHLTRGRALSALGRVEEARTEWELALASLDPFNERGTLSHGRRGVRTKALLLLDRPTEAGRELDLLRSSGYMDEDLDALAARQGL